jgi:hypothetical protein
MLAAVAVFATTWRDGFIVIRNEGMKLAGIRATAAQQALDEQIARMVRTMHRQRIAIILIALIGAAIEIRALYQAPALATCDHDQPSCAIQGLAEAASGPGE